ncbi:hypothetical protein [Microbacterium sp. NPDC096154]|uniref:hypothetical protein n=1 Tax=Microbacterium sp. NPDC096154 TaxID=3155549 RepID=UPI00332D8428
MADADTPLGPAPTRPSHPARHATARERGLGAVLTDAYRPIRRVTPPEAPVEGVLAAVDDRRVVLADEAAASRVAFSPPGDRPQHLLTPVDVVRRGDGHDVELPWCRVQASRLLAARAASGAPLSGGELVTLAVSLLRGTREAWTAVPADGDGPSGAWWMDDQGRPLFARTEEGAAVAESSRALLAQAAMHTRDRVLLRLLEQAREALERPRRLGRSLPALEDSLFEACAPRAIEQGPSRGAQGRPAAGAHTPGADRAHPDVAQDELAQDVVVRDDIRPMRARAVSGRASALRDVFRGPIAELIDTGIPEAVADVADRMRAAVSRRRTGPRGMPALVGGGAAALVLAGGLLWPTEAPSADAHTAVATPPAASPTATAEPTAAGDAGDAADAGDEPTTEAGARVLSALRDCASHGDPLCLEVRDERAAEPLSEEALGLVAAAGLPRLLDDYGDVAVMRADSDDGEGALLLQLVRLEGRWLLRSAHPLAPEGPS